MSIRGIGGSNAGRPYPVSVRRTTIGGPDTVQPAPNVGEVREYDEHTATEEQLRQQIGVTRERAQEVLGTDTTHTAVAADPAPPNIDIEA